MQLRCSDRQPSNLIAHSGAPLYVYGLLGEVLEISSWCQVERRMRLYALVFTFLADRDLYTVWTLHRSTISPFGSFPSYLWDSWGRRKELLTCSQAASRICGIHIRHFLLLVPPSPMQKRLPYLTPSLPRVPCIMDRPRRNCTRDIAAAICLADKSSMRIYRCARVLGRYVLGGCR